jgi:hypothetical protein
MGNNDINKTENILVKVDDNNIVYIEPNSVVNNKQVEMRDVPSENLVVYVNLEADLVPRSILNINGTTGNITQPLIIAEGVVNFLKNANGGDFDTSWTESFLQPKQFKGNATNKTSDIFYQSDASAQTFGIDSITMTVKGYSVPQVTINFTDVRGKTLFESPANSPYKTLFHLPWPIFYLTVKGFFGKAIRYRLHLTKFSSKFNESNGNFDLTCTFIGSTYAFLVDIPLVGAMNAPFMYGNESVTTDKNNGILTKTVKVSRSSKGYATLVSVYDEYKRKGLIAKDFPVKTLREVVTLAKSLDETLENLILKSDVKPQIFAGINEFEKIIIDFKNRVSAWDGTYLNNQLTRNDTGRGTDTYKKLVDSENNSDRKIIGQDVNSLEAIIKNYIDQLNKTKVLTQNLSDVTFTASNFKKQVFSYINKIKSVNSYVFTDNINGSKWINISAIKNSIDNIDNQFQTQKNKFEQQIEMLMNSIVKDKNKGFGFDPTIKNIFAVICANADVYIRLLKDVHTKAFNIGKERAELLTGYSNETPGDVNIFPWPQIVKQSKDNSQKEFAYPGEKGLRKKLKSDNARLWPEVEFVEEYERVASKKVDNLASKEAGYNNINYKYVIDDDLSNFKPISTILNIGTTIPYYDKSVAPVIYEIYERGVATCFYDTFDTFTSTNQTLVSLANIELDNITNAFNEDYTISETLQTINGFSTTNVTKSTVGNTLNELLRFYSPNEKYLYYLDNLFTNEYIKTATNTPFKAELNITTIGTVNDSTSYTTLSNALKNYTPVTTSNTSPSYRNYIYPFNSPAYLSYLNKKIVDVSDMQFNGLFSVDTTNGNFIKTPILPLAWVNDQANLFSKKLMLDSDNSINILNTPFFHNQLLNDFTNNEVPYGRYAGSAYLLLNSLQYKDLQDLVLIGNEPIRMSHLFKELGSTHFVPYHLILKWGSLYHRYKTFLTKGNDILNGVTGGTNNTIKSPDLNYMFNGNVTGTTYTVNGITLNYSGSSVGFNPFYEASFHQIVNGYSHYDIDDPTSYQKYIDSNSIYSKYQTISNTTYWSNFVDNSQYNNNLDNFYTILPTCGNNSTYNLNLSYVTNGNIEDGFKVVLEDELIPTPISNKKIFPSPSQYNLSFDTGYTYDKQYSLYGTYREILDLIGTFSPDILDYFETLFLQFASERENTEYAQKSFDDYTISASDNSDIQTHVVFYQNFQEMLKDIVTVPKKDSDVATYSSILYILKTRQKDNFTNITNKLLGEDNLIKLTLGNPKEYDLNIFESFARGINQTPFGVYDDLQKSDENLNYIKLYCGTDTDLNYLNFFTYNNILLNEENIKSLRPLIYIWAGYVQNEGQQVTNLFKQYIIDNILAPYDIRKQEYFRNLLPKFKDKMKNKSVDKQITISDGFGMDILKQQSYDYFKSFNDKWSSGNSIGQRTLLEEFLFLDKANRDIGNKAYITLEKIKSFENSAEDKTSLFSGLAAMIAGTDFDLRGMPAYVNFYGTDFTKSGKITPSKKVAKDIFGTYLEVDYQESTPKIIIQYVGKTSIHPDGMQDISKTKYLFNDDGFKIYDPVNNPLRVTIPDVFDSAVLGNSNRVVGFEVNVGDQNQSMFKSVQLDQESLRNTSEFFHTLEQLSRSESGASTYSVDSGMFDLYRTRSYTCTVISMGNVMIQPTMYFYIKNIPMFRGTYWITDVTHEIKPNSVTTKFVGVRMNRAALPDAQTSFMTGYKPYFEKLLTKASAKQPQITTTTTDTTVNSKSTSATIASIPTVTKYEQKVSEIGVDTKFGIRYNGYKGEKYILKVKINGQDWYKTTVVKMGGQNYPITDETEMAVLNKLKTKSNNTITGSNSIYFTNNKIKWGDIKKYNSKNYENNYFYSLRFDLTSKDIDPLVAINLNKATTEFLTSANTTSSIDEIIEPMVLGIDNTITPDLVKGPIHAGPLKSIDYGIGLSKGLMKALKLKDGDPVLFRLY